MNSISSEVFLLTVLPMVFNVIAFLACSALITFSGTQLSREGNKLAEFTGISKAWIGLILMATVTSLPELVTGISAVAVVRAPDLAAGNVLGSCAFNLLMLSLLDLFAKRPLVSLVRISHIVSAAFSIILLALVGAGISFRFDLFQILWVSPLSIILLVVYTLAMRAVFLYEQRHPLVADQTPSFKIEKSNSVRKVLLVYTFHAMIVVLAALFLPYFGEKIATRLGLSETFFGTVFLAITTSLPEIVVSFSALRLGVLDMAMANLLGSNVFNVAILAFTDFFHTTGSLYASLSNTHILSIFSSIIMTAIVTIGLMVRPEQKRWRLSIDAWLILIVYLFSIFMLR